MNAQVPVGRAEQFFELAKRERAARERARDREPKPLVEDAIETGKRAFQGAVPAK